MEVKFIPLFFIAYLTSCTCTTATPDLFQNLFVDDFYSDDIHACTTSDVELNNVQARAFFNRAKVVEYKILHDHYEIAPCYIMGPVNYRGKQCTWKIRPGGTASITCGNKTTYFVCDDCEGLYNKSR